jgi:hypothetical protein
VNTPEVEQLLVLNNVTEGVRGTIEFFLCVLWLVNIPLPPLLRAGGLTAQTVNDIVLHLEFEFGCHYPTEFDTPLLEGNVLLGSSQRHCLFSELWDLN